MVHGDCYPQMELNLRLEHNQPSWSIPAMLTSAVRPPIPADHYAYLHGNTASSLWQYSTSTILESAAARPSTLMGNEH